MTNLQDLIDVANHLSITLEKASNDEKKFCFDLQMTLEQMSWQALRMANDLKEIRSYT